MSKEVKVLISIAFLVLVGGVVLSLVANPKPKDAGAPVDQKSLIREHSPMTGRKEAKVQVVEFADFQCPACAQAAPVLKRLMGEYKDNPEVNFVYRYFPLEQIHRNARIAAEAAASAGEQGKFWEMNELLYGKQNDWSASTSPLDSFLEYAASLGLKVDQMKQSVEMNQHKDIIDADIKDGSDAGVNSTPTIFVNGVKAESYKYEILKQNIEDALAGKQPTPPAPENQSATTTPSPVQEQTSPATNSTNLPQNTNTPKQQ